MIPSWRKHQFEVLLFTAYLLLALAVTYPLVLNLNNSIYGVRGDHFVQLWESWWRKGALLKGESLTFTPLIYAPSGFDFSSYPLQPLPTILNLGLTLLTNEVLALNILLLLSFPLSGLAVYFLVKRLLSGCKARPCEACKAWPCRSLAAAFSGLIYSFSMYHFSHAWEHSTLISIYWMPFYVLALINFDGKKDAKSAVIAALLFAAVLWDNFYYGYLMIFFSIFFVLIRWRNYLDWQRIKLFLLFALCSLIFVSPAVLPILRRSLSPQSIDSWLVQESYERSLHDLNWFSARPWFYLLPSPYHPLWGRVSKNILNWLATKPPQFLTKPYARVEHNLYLGWTAILLSAVAVFAALRKRLSTHPVIPSEAEESSEAYNAAFGLDPSTHPPAGGLAQDDRGREQTWLFLFLGVTMMVFSAPPMVTISGLKIYFPAHFLHKVFPMFSAYARFGVLVLLCVSVLAGFGLTHLLKKIQQRRYQYLLTVGLSGIVLLEVLLPSFNVDLTPPEAYQWLKDQPGDFIVVEFPPRSDHSGLLYQRFHGKRLFNPVAEHPHDVLYAPEEQISSQALLLRNLREYPEPIAELEVKYLVFHENDPLLSFDLNYFGPPYFNLIKTFPGIGVYEVGRME